jgi:C4-dicarboxylate-specific signal transduction histidine kinase
LIRGARRGRVPAIGSALPRGFPGGRRLGMSCGRLYLSPLHPERSRHARRESSLEFGSSDLTIVDFAGRSPLAAVAFREADAAGPAGSDRRRPAPSIASFGSTSGGNEQRGDRVDETLLRRTAELANAAASLTDGVQAVQSYLARTLGWRALGYRIFAGGHRSQPQDAEPFPQAAAADALLSSSQDSGDAGRDRLVLIRIEDGACPVAVLGFRSRRREATVEEHALLSAIGHQLAVLAQRDICRQGLLARELEILHQGQLAGMAEVAQSLSHELSQPLAALTAYAAALRRRLDGDRIDSAEISYLGERLLQQVERAGGILQATKTFVLQRTCPTGTVDVEATIRQLTRFARWELRTASIDLRLDVAPGLSPARGSEPHLTQILLSLLANAMTALQTVPVEQRKITFRAVQAEREVHIGIIDSGRHLVAESRDRQGSFYAAYADSRRMGLAISHSLAEIQGGRLWQEQNDGETSFIVALPVMH